jgi:hypothetical protein
MHATAPTSANTTGSSSSMRGDADSYNTFPPSTGVTEAEVVRYF